MDDPEIKNLYVAIKINGNLFAASASGVMYIMSVADGVYRI